MHFMRLPTAIVLGVSLIANATHVRAGALPAQAPAGGIDLAAEVAAARARQAVLMHGDLPIPESGFYVSNINFIHKRIDFRFGPVPRLAVCASPGAVIWGWTVVGVTPDAKHAPDGFAMMKPPDGSGEVNVWTHFGVVLPQDVWRMDYDQWQHHANQPDALMYRAAHRIVVVNKPDGVPDDEQLLPVVPLPKPAPLPDDRRVDSATLARVRNHIEKELGTPLSEAKAIPNVDFYVSDVDPLAKKVTFRFPAAPAMWVVIRPGDSVCGWIVNDFRADPSRGADAAAVLTPDGYNHSVEIWKQLPPPAAGEIIKMDAVKWARHQFEPDARRLRAEGRIVVSGEAPTTEPADGPPDSH